MQSRTRSTITECTGSIVTMIDERYTALMTWPRRPILASSEPERDGEPVRSGSIEREAVKSETAPIEQAQMEALPSDATHSDATQSEVSRSEVASSSGASPTPYRVT